MDDIDVLYLPQSLTSLKLMDSSITNAGIAGLPNISLLFLDTPYITNRGLTLIPHSVRKLTIWNAVLLDGSFLHKIPNTVTHIGRCYPLSLGSSEAIYKFNAQKRTSY
jgi:hypothetical protein